MLRDYALFIRNCHLRDFTEENLRLVEEMDIPLMALFKDVPREVLFEQSLVSNEKFLTDLAEGTAAEAAQESLRAWEEDRLPGIPKDAILPSDLVLVYAAQKQALLKFLPLYVPGAKDAVPILNQLEGYYVQSQKDAFELLTRLRAESSRREAALRLEKEATERHSEELQAMNEELQTQQEELESLYEQLQQQNEEVEAEVGRRSGELARSESKFKAVFDKAAIGMATADVTGRVMETNRALQTMLGYSAEEIAQLDLTKVMQPEDLPEAAVHFRDLAGGHTDRFQAERRYRRKDGSLMWGRLTVTPVRNEDGAVIFLVSMIEDITKRREAEDAVAHQLEALQQANEELRQADQYKDEFLSVISHELRTPLNFITGFASILDDEVDGPLSERQHLHLGKILSGSDRMLHLVNDLLDFAKLQAGKFELSPEPTPYAPLVDEVVASMRPLADAKRIGLEVDVRVPDAPTLDGSRVVQVLTNLVSNAIKFTPAGGTIVIQAIEGDGRLMTRVADSGVGIAEGDIPKLFNRFRQLDMSMTREAGGTGLGLAISKALVEAHGGTIGVDSHIGHGSTFWFELPLTGAEPGPVKAQDLRSEA